jgi:hypothetical protein
MKSSITSMAILGALADQRRGRFPDREDGVHSAASYRQGCGPVVKVVGNLCAAAVWLISRKTRLQNIFNP